MTAPPITPILNPAHAPSALDCLREPFIVRPAKCKECDGTLSETYHVVRGVVKCDKCFRVDVASVNVERMS